ncbi:MAG TPA: response regulator transcription factor [Nitriliruptorales bacterium]
MSDRTRSGHAGGGRHIDVVAVGSSPYERARLVWRLDGVATVVGTGGSVPDATRTVHGHAPTAAIVLDDDPGSVVRWCAELRRRWPTIGVVVWGGAELGEVGRRLMRAGPTAVLPPHASDEVLAWAVRTVAVGESAVSLADDGPRPVVRDGNGHAGVADADLLGPIALTRAERGVLDAMARGRTNDEIAEELGISRHTVKTHVSHVTAKLGAANRTDAARIFLRALSS